MRACKVAGEHDLLGVGRELGVVGQAAVRVKELAQPGAIGPDLRSRKRKKTCHQHNDQGSTCRSKVPHTPAIALATQHVALL